MLAEDTRYSLLVMSGSRSFMFVSVNLGPQVPQGGIWRISPLGILSLRNPMFYKGMLENLPILCSRECHYLYYIKQQILASGPEGNTKRLSSSFKAGSYINIFEKRVQNKSYHISCMTVRGQWKLSPNNIYPFFLHGKFSHKYTPQWPVRIIWQRLGLKLLGYPHDAFN